MAISKGQRRQALLKLLLSDWPRSGLLRGYKVLSIALLLASCDLYEYGRLGGADLTIDYYPPKPDEEVSAAGAFEALMENLSGVWYSHYAGIGRLDGYRIGRWEDFEELVLDTGKDALLPNLDWPGTKTYAGYEPRP
jgi:hypothetical protein